MVFLFFAFISFNLLKKLFATDFYISNTSSCNKTCLGTFSDPFSNLIIGLNNISEKSKKENLTLINIILKNSFYNILEEDVKKIEPLQKIKYIFANLSNNTKISIFPFNCKNQLKNCDKYTEIAIKTSGFSLLIALSLNITNIKFTGYDIHINKSMLIDKKCLKAFQGCCNMEKINLIRNQTVFTSNLTCNLRNYKNSLTKNNINKIHGIFSFSINEKNKFQYLNFFQCNFYMINSVTQTTFYFNYLIGFNQKKNFSINFLQSSIEKVYFPMGIISEKQNSIFQNDGALLNFTKGKLIDYNFFGNDKFKIFNLALKIAIFINSDIFHSAHNTQGFETAFALIIFKNSNIDLSDYFFYAREFVTLKIINSFITNKIEKGFKQCLGIVARQRCVFNIINTTFDQNNKQVTMNLIIFYLLKNLYDSDSYHKLFMDNVKVKFFKGLDFIRSDKACEYVFRNCSFNNIITVVKQFSFFDFDGLRYQNVLFFNVNFTNVKALIFYLAYASNIILKNVYFYNCFKNQDNYILQLQLPSKNVIILDSKAENIFSYYLFRCLFLKIIIKNSLFINSKTTLFYFVGNYKGSIKFLNSKCKNLTSEQIYATVLFIEKNSSIFVKNSIFLKNHAFEGGLIYIGDNSNLTFYNNTINFSSAKDGGGVFFLNKGTKLMVENSSFLNLSISLSKNKGGCLIYLNEFCFFSIINSNLSKFYSASYGGVFHAVSQNKIIIKDIIITKEIISEVKGGFNYAGFGNYIIFKNFTIPLVKSKKFAQGGMISLLKENIILLSQLLIFKSFSSGGGGTIALEEKNYVKMYNCSVKNSTDNSSIGGGLIYSLYFNVISIRISNFSNLLTAGKGGLINSLNFNLIYLNNCLTINSRDNSNSGGGVFYSQISNSLIIYLCKFDNVKAKESGACGKFLEKNYVFIYKSHFNNVEDYSISAGGSCFNFFSSNIAYLNESNFLHSKSQKDGGLIRALFNNNIKINYCKFKLSLGINGGLIEITQKNTVFINKSSMIDNQALSLGDVIYAINLNDIRISQCIIQKKDIKNSANKMSILFCFVENNNRAFIDKTDFEELYSTRIFYVNKGYIRLDKVRIINLKTSLIEIIQSFNSLIYLNRITFMIVLPLNTQIYKIEKSQFIIRNSLINNLYSQKNYQFITFKKNLSLFHLINSNISVLRLNFYGNDQKLAVRVFEAISSNFLMKKSCFINNILSNTLNFGSILKLEGTLVEIFTILIQNFFFKNIAKYGGVIYLNNADNILFLKNYFIKNDAIKGGAFKILSFKKIKVIDNIFKRNNAKNQKQGKGGTIYFGKLNFIDKNLIYCHNNSFINNTADSGGILFFYNYLQRFTIDLTLDMQYKNIFKFNTANFHGVKYSTNLLFYNFEDKKLIKNIQELKSLGKFTRCIVYIYPYDNFKQMAYKTDEDYTKFIESPNINDFQFYRNLSNNFYCITDNIYRKNDDLKLNYTLKINSTVLNLNVGFKKGCDIGDVFTKTFNCVPCSNDSFSFSIEFETLIVCQDCNKKNFYCFGGFNLTPKSTYWRLSIKSTNFIKCFNPDACLGDNRKYRTNFDIKYAIGLCGEGYQFLFFY